MLNKYDDNGLRQGLWRFECVGPNKIKDDWAEIYFENGLRMGKATFFLSDIEKLQYFDLEKYLILINKKITQEIYYNVNDIKEGEQIRFKYQWNE